MLNSIELLVVFLICVAPYLVWSLWVAVYGDQTTQIRHPFLEIVGDWTRALGEIALVYYAVGASVTGLRLLGIGYAGNSVNQDWNLWIIFAPGLIYALYGVLVRWIWGARPKSLGEWGYLEKRLSPYQTGVELLTYISVMLWAVTAEEIVYRGYFVLVMGARTGDYLTWSVISIVLFTAVHLYQGRDPLRILTHVVNAATLTLLAWWFRNLYLSIMVHMLLNFIVVLRTWPNREASEEQTRLRTMVRIGPAVYLVIMGLSLLMYYMAIAFIGSYHG